VTYLAVMVLASATLLSAQSSASIATDKNHYSVGETMTITGSGFSPNASVAISIDRPDKAVDYVTGVATDGSGAFSALYAPSAPAVPGRYKITASDGANSAKTASTEADAIGYNKAVYNKGTVAQNDTTGVWTSGNAGSNYRENQWSYYQYQIEGIGSDVPSFDVFFNHFQAKTPATFLTRFAHFPASANYPHRT